MERVVTVPSRNHRGFYRVEATRVTVRTWKKSKTQSLKNQMEFPSKAMVDPEVEDTIEEAIGGW